MQVLVSNANRVTGVFTDWLLNFIANWHLVYWEEFTAYWQPANSSRVVHDWVYYEVNKF